MTGRVVFGEFCLHGLQQFGPRLLQLVHTLGFEGVDNVRVGDPEAFKVIEDVLCLCLACGDGVTGRPRLAHA